MSAVLCNCGLFKPQHIFKPGLIPSIYRRAGWSQAAVRGYVPNCTMARDKAPFFSVSEMRCCLFNLGDCQMMGFPIRMVWWFLFHVRLQAKVQSWSAFGFSSIKLTILPVSCPAFYKPWHPVWPHNFMDGLSGSASLLTGTGIGQPLFQLRLGGEGLDCRDEESCRTAGTAPVFFSPRLYQDAMKALDACS